jgi:hypothetical protein
LSKAGNHETGNSRLCCGVGSISVLFLGTGDLRCLDAADSNDSGAVDISDAVYSLQFLFIGGPAPKSPFPECGMDPFLDDLTSESFSACQ